MTRSRLALAVALAAYAVAVEPNGRFQQEPITSTCGWPDLPAYTEVGPLAMFETEDSTSQIARAVEDLIRWHRSCDPSAARRAELRLRQRLGSNPKDTAAVALRAIALARGPDVQLVSGGDGYLVRAVHRYSNAEKEARRAFIGLAQSPKFRSIAALELTALALATRDRATVADATRMLRTVLGSSASPELWVALADVQRVAGDFRQSRQSALSALNSDYPAAYHAVASARLHLDDDPSTAADQYIQGLVSRQAPVYRYWDDLRPLLGPARIADANGQTEEHLRGWIAAEWQWMAANSGITVADRLAEHQRRLHIAATRYPRSSFRGARPLDALTIDSALLLLPFDDRGLVFIRYGEPDKLIALPPGKSGLRREAWVYRELGSDDVVLEFLKATDVSDYTLAAPLSCDPFVMMYGYGGLRGESTFERYARRVQPQRDVSVAATNVPATIGEDVPMNGWDAEFRRVFLDYATALGSYDPALALTAFRCHAAVTGRMNEPLKLLDEVWYAQRAELQQRMLAQRNARAVLATESASPRYAKPIKAVASLYAFRGTQGTQLAAVVGVPASQLRASAVDTGAPWQFNMSLIIQSSLLRRVLRRDTVFSLPSPGVLDADALIRAGLDLETEPMSDAAIQIRLNDVQAVDRGDALMISRSIPSFAAPLAISDLVISESVGGRWIRSGVALAPIPGHRVAQDATFRLYYETYGALNGDELDIDILIAPGSRSSILERLADLVRRRHAMRLSFREAVENAQDGTSHVERQITPNLQPGTYQVTVAITRQRDLQHAAATTDLVVF